MHILAVSVALLLDLQGTLALIPEDLRATIYAVVLALVGIAVALIVHSTVVKLTRRALPQRHPYLHSVFMQMEGPLRLALVLLALNFAVGVAPLDPGIKFGLARALQLAFIGFLGWMALTSINILADLYLRRYDITAADNLLARKHVTQVRVLSGALNTLVVVVTIAAALMTFDSVRQIGVGLFASAGIAGIVAGFAARPLLSNLLAGVQLALTQPIRVDDVVVVEKEWGRIEDITLSYVVIRLWDLRRLIVPLSYFIEKPFENWTRENSSIIGTVFLYVDYTAPVDRLREKLAEILGKSDKWDGSVGKIQVTDAKENSVELRILVSARDSSMASDLRNEVREKMISFLATDLPNALPHSRQEAVGSRSDPSAELRDVRRSRSV